MSLSTKVLIGVVAGIFTGLFFGEYAQFLSIPGDVFVGLLQMTVLPYIMFSLIVNIGRLSMEEGKKLIKNGIVFLLLLLGVGLVYLAVLPLSFPEWGSGSFYSNDFIAPSKELDIVKLYVPANLFESLAANTVPAVVLFSIFLGLGLMNLSKKEVLLKPLDILNEGLNQVNKLVIKLTPIGVWCIAAGVTSSMGWEEFSRLQGYILVYILAIVLLTFVVLPMLISLFTPYSPARILKILRPTLITIFATGKIIVVYPQLIENIKEILKTINKDDEENKKAVDVLMPLAYPFPNLGTFIIFVFVPFAAWYSGQELIGAQYPLFLSSTLLSSFVAPITGLPFTMSVVEVPEETFQLFVISTVITDRVRVVLGAFHLVVLTLLTTAAAHGYLQFNLFKFFKNTAIVLVLSAASIFGIKKVLEISLRNIPTNKEVISQFEFINEVQPFEILDQAVPHPTRKRRGENTLSRIKRSGELRVGFYADEIPFSFYNSNGDLVGFGIDLAHGLAKDLNVKLVLAPIEPGTLVTNMKQDYYDIVMSDIFLSSLLSEELSLSKPYMDVTLAMLVKKERNEFRDFNSVSKLDTFHIGFFERKEILEEFSSYFPQSKGIQLNEVADYFDMEGDSIQLDGLLTSAERASALTLLHPEYQVVNPLPLHMTVPLIFPINGQEAWRDYINSWIDIRSKDGHLDIIRDQWILGYEYKKASKSWSIMKDVLGWVD